MVASATVLIILTLVSTAAVTTILAFGIIQQIPNNGIFNHTQLELAEKYPSDILPATYVFSIWGLIFLFQFGWLGYVYSTMCRTNCKGNILVNPVVLPKKFHFAWIVSCAGTTAWYFFYDAELFLISALILVVVTVSGFVALMINTVRVARYESKFATQMYADLMCLRVLLQNGLDLFFSFTFYSALLTLSVALTYDPNSPTKLSQEDAGSLSLYTLGVVVIVWSLLENTKLFRLAKYTYSWYLVLIWCLAGVIVRYPDVTKKNTIITIVLLCVSVVCLCVKITVFACAPSKTFRKAKKYTLLEEE